MDDKLKTNNKNDILVDRYDPSSPFEHLIYNREKEERREQRDIFLTSLFENFENNGANNVNLLTSTKFNFEKDLKILNGKNIQVGKGVGTIIGTEATQKLGFFGQTPTAQISAITDPTGGAVVDAEARTKIIQIVDALQALGLVA